MLAFFAMQKGREVTAGGGGSRNRTAISKTAQPQASQRALLLGVSDWKGFRR